MFNQFESVIVTRNLDVCLPSEAETPTIDPTAQCTISESIGKITSAAKILHPRLSLTFDYLCYFNRADGIHFHVAIRIGNRNYFVFNPGCHLFGRQCQTETDAHAYRYSITYSLRIEIKMIIIYVNQI